MVLSSQSRLLVALCFTLLVLAGALTVGSLTGWFQAQLSSEPIPAKLRQVPFHHLHENHSNNLNTHTNSRCFVPLEKLIFMLNLYIVQESEWGTVRSLDNYLNALDSVAKLCKKLYSLQLKQSVTLSTNVNYIN